MPDLDLHPLSVALERAARVAFSDLVARHGAESIYCAALYTNGPRSFLGPIVLTERGLDQAVSHYVTDLKYQATPRLRHELRWSPEDSPFHSEGWHHFRAVEPLMLEVAEAIHAIDTETSWDGFDAFLERLDGALCEVLLRLDREGIFGVDAARRGLVLTVMMGDQDETILDFAKRLNAPEVFRAFETEWRSEPPT